jgi:hypothetical protein
MLARRAGGGVRAPRASNRGAGGKGQGALARGSTHEATRTKRVPNACLTCGVILSIDERGHARKICDECLPAFEAERTEKLRATGQNALMRMRRSDDDPAQSLAAQEKRIASSRDQMLAIRAWERENGMVHDLDRYEAEVVPMIAVMTVPELVHLTGLSRHYCWQVRVGKKRLHPMHWSAVIAFSVAKARNRS